MKTVLILTLLLLFNSLCAQESDRHSFKVYFQTTWDQEVESYVPVLKLLATEKEKLVKFNLELKDKNMSKYIIYLEGHTDEWGADEYNHALGLKLAQFVQYKVRLENAKKDLSFIVISIGESEAKKEFIANSEKPMINYNTYVKVSFKKNAQ